MVKLYLSNFEVDEETKRHTDFEIKVPKLLDELKMHGIEIIYLKDFKGYDKIEKTIAQCDCMLAIVDEYWMSSTWKAIEVTYANGGAGSGMTTNNKILKRPVFIFPVYKNVKLSFLKTYVGPVILPSDVNKAVNIILSKII